MIKHLLHVNTVSRQVLTSSTQHKREISSSLTQTFSMHNANPNKALKLIREKAADLLMNGGKKSLEMLGGKRLVHDEQSLEILRTLGN